MPSGAKKRKALKKKQQQEVAIGTSRNNNNGDNLHGGGNEEHGGGSQDDRESDSNLSSPGSQGNEQFGGSAAMVKETAKEISGVTQGLGSTSGNAIAVERATDDKIFIVEKSPISSYENTTNVASQDPCAKEIAPALDSVSKAVISEKSERADTSTRSGAGENGKVATLPGAASGTSKMLESVRESEVPLSPEEKRLLFPGPPAVRTSWLSCCGLFDAMTGSDR